MIRSYDIHGMRLHVRASHPVMLERVDALLRPFAVPDGLPADGGFRLVVEHGRVPSGEVLARPLGRPAGPGELPLVWRGELPGGLQSAYYAEADRRQIDLPGLASMRLDLARRLAHITVKPGCEWCLSRGCLVPLLCEFLKRVGQYVLHAASLARLNGPNPPALLLAGPSGMGKTTAALALAHAGLHLLADDASFVHCGDGASARPEAQPDSPVSVWGLPRPCKVHERTMALLPWLAAMPHEPVGGGEHLINLARIAGPTLTRQARPVAILFIGPRNDRAHCLEPLDKVAALSRLVRENLRPVDRRGCGPAGRQFAVLAHLVGQARTFLLSVCPSLKSLHEVVMPLLEGQ